MSNSYMAAKTSILALGREAELSKVKATLLTRVRSWPNAPGIKNVAEMNGLEIEQELLAKPIIDLANGLA